MQFTRPGTWTQDAAVCHALSHWARVSPRRGSSQPSGRPAFPVAGQSSVTPSCLSTGPGTGTFASPEPGTDHKAAARTGPGGQSGAVAAANSSTNHGDT